MNCRSVKHLAAALIILGVVGCAKSHGPAPSEAPQPLTQGPGEPDHGPAVGDIVVKSTFTVYVTSDGASVHMRAGNPTTIPISVINAPNTSMTVNTNSLIMPPITNAALSFGSLGITGLLDNNLRVCGTNGKTKCGNAVIRIYTTGAGAGMWNADGGYGMPITVALGSARPLDVGLGSANAAVIQTTAIASASNVFHLSDFVVTPTYNIFSDFTNAGAGTYSTTLVVEYGLTL